MVRSVRRRGTPGRRFWVDSSSYSGLRHIKTLGHSPDPPLTRGDSKLLSLLLAGLVLVPAVGVGIWWTLIR